MVAANKKSVRVSKSELIRQELAKHPDDSPANIVTRLKKRGVLVDTNLINVVKHNMKHPTYHPQRTAAMFAVKEFVRALGGVDEAQEALDLYKSLMEDKVPNKPR